MFHCNHIMWKVSTTPDGGCLARMPVHTGLSRTDKRYNGSNAPTPLGLMMLAVGGNRAGIRHSSGADAGTSTVWNSCPGLLWDLLGVMLTTEEGRCDMCWPGHYRPCIAQWDASQRVWLTIGLKTRPNGARKVCNMSSICPMVNILFTSRNSVWNKGTW